jgi:polysaccharide biosynthesis/export protein
MYKQNIMFRPGKNTTGSAIKDEHLRAERNHIVQPNDQLYLDVFSNKGERIIDPNGELLKEPSGTLGTPTQRPPYWVAVDGTLKAPMIGTVRVAGLTIREAEMFLQKEFDQFYKECFVNLTFQNKRFTVLGGVEGQVIPLVNENIKLTEALALAKGVTNESKVHNIRLIRGDDVYFVDFSTIEGLRKGNMIVQPGDVIYIEPVRKPFIEGLRDFSAFGSLIVSVGTLVIIIINTTK